jgi:hypothetical protein
VDGLFRDDRAGGQLNLVAARPPNDRVEWFTAITSAGNRNPQRDRHAGEL